MPAYASTGRRQSHVAVTVRLPDLPAVPLVHRGREYVVRRLLADGDSNAKLLKSNRAGRGYRTFGLSLAPADASGYQMCASSSPGCRAACLFHQGRAKWPTAVVARVAKTVAFVEHREWFEERLRLDVALAVRHCRKHDLIPAIRLNVVSDVQWEAVFPWLFTRYEEVQYYDYTKHARRALKFARGGGPANYHLTFSRSEVNDQDAQAVLAAGGNVAVVFRSPPLPATWCGYPVVDGDRTDLRFLDGANVVVGLKAKGTAKDDASGFVVGNRTPLVVIDGN